MSVILSILAAGSLPALIFGAPVPSLLSRDVAVADVQSLQIRSETAYTTLFGGDGSTSDGWPSMDSWVSSFDEMFDSNKPLMASGCSNLGDGANDSDDEINDLYNAIKSVSASSNVDARFILAIVMQESKGCVRVHTTNYGVRNPGLMQSHNGQGTCNPGTPVSPCPADEITQMIKDGTMGTADGDGLQQLLAQAASEYKASGAQAYYLAARMYNSGSINADGNLGDTSATACYATDVANRLLGWAGGNTPCQSDVISTLNHAEVISGGGSSGSTTTTPASVTSATAPATSVTVSPDPATTTAPTETTPAASPTTTSSTTTTVSSTAVATLTTTVATPASATPAAAASSTATVLGPKYPGAISTCKQWILVVSGDYCIEVENDVKISASQFLDWNPGLDAACSNLWLGYEYCIDA